MAISFNSVPSDLRIPFVAVEIDNSRATQGPALLQYNALLLIQKSAAGTGTADTIVRVTSADEVGELAGRDSVGFLTAQGWFSQNTSTPTYAAILADDGAGTAATGTVTISGPATAAGTLHLYVHGVYVPVAVASGDTATNIGDAVVTAVTAKDGLAVTAANVAGVVTFTAVNKGTAGNDFDLRLNYQTGEEYPAGVSAVVVEMSGGGTDPDLANIIAAMGDDWYQICVNPFESAASFTALETEYASRFGPARMIDGLIITGAGDATVSALATVGNSRNSPHHVILAKPYSSNPVAACQFGAAAAGVIAYYAQIDPARPLQTLPLVGILPPAAKFTDSERNSLLFDGIATTKVDAAGVVRLERVITTYQTNAAGAPDVSYLDAATMLTLLYLRYSFRARIQTRYPRHKLASDGARFGAGQAVITPILGKAEALAWFREMETLGLVEGFSQFKRDVVVERNATDVNRLDFLLPPDLINQLIVTAAQIQFRL